jgi:adenylate cyclase
MKKVDLISTFAGKYVLVGTSGELLHDQIKSPVSGNLMDGVELHAHFLDGILQKRFLRGYDITSVYFGVGMIFLTLCMVTLYIHVPKFVSLFVSFFMIFYLIWIGRYLYFSYGIVLDMMVVLLAGSVLSFPVTFTYRFFVVDREKRMLKNAFSHYVDPEVVKQISDKAHTIKL